jgi:uncharacterized membrane protein YqgA involved in biofilm formation
MKPYLPWVVIAGMCVALVVSHMKHAVTADALRIVSVALGHTIGAIDALERRISDIERKAP